jgi:putative transposase
LEISLRTYQRWMRDGDNAKVDGRTGSRRVAPADKLSEDERRQILASANSPEFASSPPSQIMPTLADRGRVSGIRIDRLPDIERREAAALPRPG